MVLKKSTNEKKPLAGRKEAFRLWFEYLRLAQQSKLDKVKKALLLSEPYYRSWDMDPNIKFDAWWKTHAQLFEEKHVVRVLKATDKPIDRNALIIEVPLTMTTTMLMKQIRSVVKAEMSADKKLSVKGRKKASSNYYLTIGSEPKLDAVREMLTVYREVYLKKPNLRGEKLYQATQEYYLRRKSTKLAKIPIALMHDTGNGRNIGEGRDYTRVLRNLRRYIQKSEKIMLNVAKGQFPGKY